MKKVLFILLTALILSGCKNDQNKDNQSIDTDSSERTVKQRDGLTLLKGDFLYTADAAVLQTHREVYGVVIDKKMHELDEMAQQFKQSSFDWVKVEIRGKISAKPEGEEGWPNRIEIKEIISVSKADNTNEEVIKIEN